MIMRIRELRKQATLSQAELAEAVGVAQNTVSQWELETAFPRVRQLPAIARALGCGIEELFEVARDEN